MDGIDNLVDSQLCFGFFVIFFIHFFHFSSPSVLGFVLGGIGRGGGRGASGACLGHVSLVATPEAPAFLHHGGLLFFCEGTIDPARRVDHHGDCSSASLAMGLSFRFKGATPFAFSLSKPRLFLFLWVEAAQPEPYVVFRVHHVFPFMPSLGVVFGDDILSQGIREASSKEVQGAFLIQPISSFGSQGLKPGDIGIEIYALHADAVQLC